MDRLTALPDNCIHTILSKTSPRDACRCSAISKLLKKVADSDVLWSVFLPSDYQQIILRSATQVVYSDCSCLKQLYLRLSDSPILLDGANMSVALEKESGKKCIVIGARNPRIVWGDTPPLYLIWEASPRSRFPEVARLPTVHGFEITGRVKTQLLSPKTTYAAYLVCVLDSWNTGLASLPMKGLVRFVGESEDDGAKTEPNTIYLELRSYQRAQMAENGFLPQDRKDGWLEVELGEIFNDQENEREVEMQFSGRNHPNWNSALFVEGLELRPKVDPQVN